MRIAFDVTPSITGLTGIARYVTSLGEAIDELPTAPDLRRFAIGRGIRAPGGAVRHLRVPLRVVDRSWRAVPWPTVEQLVGPVQSVHASGPVLPPARAPLVAVVHDLAALDRPDLHPARDVAQLRRYIGGLDRAAAVIAVSATTGARLVDHGVPADRVHVVENGYRPWADATPPPLAGRPYILAVGAPVPRKAYDVLVRAVARLQRPDVALAIIGPRGVEDDSLARLVAERGLGDRVHRAGPVSEAELAGWYQHASVLAAPSVDEGFGLGLVEALAAGVPVVASDIAVFREVTGGHAALVPRGDDGAFADALAAALDRSSSVTAAVERGAAHVARYTWERCASETTAVHRLVTS